MAIKTWVGTTANWNVSTNWSPAAVPIATDDLVFNNSAASNVNSNYTFNSIDFTGYTGTLSGGNGMTIAGSSTGTATGVAFRFSTGMTSTWTGSITFTSGVGGYITFSGKSVAGITFNNATGVWVVQDVMNQAGNFVITAGNVTFLANATTSGTMTLTAGTLTALNCANITFGGFNSNNSNTRTINMGCGTWTATGITPWVISTITGLTFNAEQSRLVFNNTSTSTLILNSGGLSYYTFEIARGSSTGLVSIAGNNTFVNFIDNTSTAAHGIQFNGITTNSFYRFIVKGSAGNAITITRGISGAYSLIKLGRDVVSSSDYIIFGSSFTATPSNTWYIGPNSTSLSTGLILSNPPSVQSLLGAGGVG